MPRKPKAASKQFTLRSGPARLAFRPGRGVFDIAAGAGGGSRILAATSGVILSTEPDKVVTLEGCRLMAVSLVEGRIDAAYKGPGFDLDVSIQAAPRAGAFEINFGLTNASAGALPVRALLPLCSTAATRVYLGVPENRIRVYRNSHFSSGVSNVIGLADPHEEYAEDDRFSGPAGLVAVKGLVRSSLVTGIKCRAEYLTMGFLSGARQFGMLSVAARGGSRGPALSAAALAEGKPIAPGRRYWAEPLYVGFSCDCARGLADYASLLAERMDARRAPEVPVGWSSWHRYYEEVKESDCLENLDWLRANRLRLGLRVFEVGGGWQADVGDWRQANEKFLRGMKALAADVRAAGFTPALWFAPFVCSSTSKVFRDHPDWVVKAEDGLPLVYREEWDRDVYALDLTNPRVLSFIAEVTSAICYDWGYDYVRIDLLAAAAVKGARLDDTKTGAQNLRRGLEVIRQVAGPDKYILASNCPLGPAIGLVDGMRVSGDVAPHWAGDRSILSSSWSLTKFWMHNLLWHNAPDSVIVREGGTDFSPVEAETLANMVMMSGGFLMVSERMSDLTETRIAALAKLLPASTTPAVPLDLYGRSRPAVYFASGDRLLLAVFNWGDSQESYSVNPRKILGAIPATRMADFWTGEKNPIPAGAMRITLPAHQSKILIFA